MEVSPVMRLIIAFSKLPSHRMSRLVAELIAFMEKHSEGFKESQKNYMECLHLLNKELGEDAAVGRYKLLLLPEEKGRF